MMDAMNVGTLLVVIVTINSTVFYIYMMYAINFGTLLVVVVTIKTTVFNYGCGAFNLTNHLFTSN
jgi:hypothetical protein